MPVLLLGADMLLRRCASIDGDADRLVFFFQQDESLQLLDGDRIALLMATLVSQLLGSWDGGSGFTARPSAGCFVSRPAGSYAAATAIGHPFA